MERFNQPGWINRVWTSDLYRRAHVDVVDARDSKGLWMMHCCVFPHITTASPIFGFDVIAGKNKITGCFIDFSPTTDPRNPMCEWFDEQVSALEWRKQRDLPDWARRIFSKSMVAAGNVQDSRELEQIRELAEKSVLYYTENALGSRGEAIETILAQNYYAQNQKMNPHTPKVMASLGLDEEDVRVFVQDCLFPEIR
jgi:phycocyanobilin:ferredoxin oxidoreductase